MAPKTVKNGLSAMDAKRKYKYVFMGCADNLDYMKNIPDGSVKLIVTSPPYDLFVKHMAFYVGDIIDVGVEILPMKSLQVNMSSGPSYYEGELYNLIREGRGVPAVPLVLIGIDV